MAGFVFNNGALALQNGSVVWETADIRARLSEQTETLDKDASSMTGLGLSATDISVTSRVGPVVDLVNDRIAYQSDSLPFPSVAEGAYIDKAIVFAFITNDADSVPLTTVTLSSAVRPNGGGILVDIDTTAMFYTQQ